MIIEPQPATTRIVDILAQARAEDRPSLTAPETKVLCDAYGIPVPREALVRSAAEAMQFADLIGFPVVLKIVSPDIVRKTKAGGVVVDLRTTEAVRRAYHRIIASVQAYNASARILGVLVQQMLTADHEAIVGTAIDPSFGKVVTFGLGGGPVEVLGDITGRLAPETRDGVLSMIDGIAGARVSRGTREVKPADRDALATIILNVFGLVDDFPEIAKIDLYPVFVHADLAIAVDVRIVLAHTVSSP